MMRRRLYEWLERREAAICLLLVYYGVLVLVLAVYTGRH